MVIMPGYARNGSFKSKTKRDEVLRKNKEKSGVPVRELSLEKTLLT
jgi:hypothetical protein